MPHLPVTATATPLTVFLPPASPAPAHRPHVAHTLSAGTFATNKRSEGQGRTCLQLWGGLAAEGPSLSASAPSMSGPGFRPVRASSVGSSVSLDLAGAGNAARMCKLSG
ncbi:cysteine-rich protein 1 isoform X3 [Bos indicus x Bos taurus]|uniref:cysteine-rich protein 1 isoform X3 n=1 Tax=Bos indicus x Bos taurus TaxID=30522 RepID=UPI000F7D29B6|nr:cysteine-rich protein 1 isoform X3 [Bos indicus x Bos taurus]